MVYTAGAAPPVAAHRGVQRLQQEVLAMPHRRVPWLRVLASLPGITLVLLVALFAGSPVAYAQRGPELGLAGGPVPGAYGLGAGGLVVPGQTQVCAAFPGAEANFLFYSPIALTWGWGAPWGFPWYASYLAPPFGGSWGAYVGIGPICLWQPH
jgi:hypothetical protein